MCLITNDVQLHLTSSTLFLPQLTSLSGANYWDPISGKATWLWDGTRANVVTEVTWGDMTINFDALGSYKIVQGEHQLLGSAELRVPEEAPIIWQQLKATVVGTFSASDNPSKLKVVMRGCHSDSLDSIFRSVIKYGRCGKWVKFLQNTHVD